MVACSENAFTNMPWPFDNEEQLDEWVDAFIEEHKDQPPEDPEELEAFCKAKYPANDQDTDIDIETLLSDPNLFAIHNGHEEDVWRFILKVVARCPPEWTLDYLAAGLLEDLIAHKGWKFIDRIEREASGNPVFRRTLHGVWRNKISQEVWDRVVQARGTE